MILHMWHKKFKQHLQGNAENILGQWFSWYFNPPLFSTSIKIKFEWHKLATGS